MRGQEENEKEEVVSGHFDLPVDVYIGMVVTILTNLPKGTSETINWLVFMPEPKVIPLHLILTGEERVRIGQWPKVADHYAFEPEIGTLQKLLGKVIGTLPAYFHYDCWILAEDVPSFSCQVACFTCKMMNVGISLGSCMTAPRRSSRLC